MSFLCSFSSLSQEHHYLDCMRSFIQLQPYGIIVSSQLSNGAFTILQSLAQKYGVEILQFEPFMNTKEHKVHDFIAYTKECVRKYNEDVENQIASSTVTNDISNYVLKPYMKINDICFVPSTMILSEDSDLFPIDEVEFVKVKYSPQSRFVNTFQNMSQYLPFHVWNETRFVSSLEHNTISSFNDKKNITVTHNPAYLAECDQQQRDKLMV